MSTLRRRADSRAATLEPPAEADRAPPSLAPLDDRLGFWLRLAQQAAFDAFHRSMAPLGVSPGRLAVLLLLEANPRIRQSALAEALRVKPPNLAVLLAAMQADGLIARVEDARNRRANLLRLTSPGRALLKRAKVQEAMVEGELGAGMSPEARAALVAALRRIAGG